MFLPHWSVTYSISGAGVPSCGTDNLLPWGLNILSGSWLFGVVCDAFTTQVRANLSWVCVIVLMRAILLALRKKCPFHLITLASHWLFPGPEQWASGTWATYK